MRIIKKVINEILDKIGSKNKHIINNILNKQEKKGIATYGHSLEDCPDNKFDWDLMTIEELIDALQYQVKRNLILQKAIRKHVDVFGYKTVLQDVALERLRQNAKWGEQRHDYGTWLQILIEEIGEIAQAMQTNKGWGKESDANNLYIELIQASAVLVAIAEQVKEEREIG